MKDARKLLSVLTAKESMVCYTRSLCAYSSDHFSGTVKKCGLFKILHEKFKQVTSSRRPGSVEAAEFRQSLINAAEQNKEIEPYIGKAQVSNTLM